jgi:protease-4
MCTDHAAAADGVVAQPGTITGSIGVIDGKLNLAPALKQLGIDVGTVSVGKNALMESWYTDVTRKQQRWADSMLDRLVQDQHFVFHADVWHA